MVSVTQAGVGTYSVVLSNLYSAVVDENGETKQVTWDYSFSDNDYFGSKDDDGNLCFQLLGTSTYTIVAKVGEEKLSTGSAPASDFVVIGGDDGEGKLADVNKQPGWEGSWDVESGTYTLKAPAYGKDGLPIDYGLTYAPETQNPTPDDTYTVTAMKETLDRSNLGLLQIGDEVNVERSMLMNGRLDGHIVQGHVDQTATCTDVQDAEGSYYFTFRYAFDKEMARRGYMTVDKGSVTVNGVSLTVCNPTDDTFQVAIIPYTYEHTNFHAIRVGSVVNIEFDIIGKYISRMIQYQ